MEYIIGIAIISIGFLLLEVILAFFIQLTTREFALGLYFTLLLSVFSGILFVMLNSGLVQLVISGLIFDLVLSIPIFEAVSVLTHKINANRPHFVEFYIRSEIKNGVKNGTRPSLLFREILQNYPIAEFSDLTAQFSEVFPELDHFLFVSVGNWKHAEIDVAADRKLDEIVERILK